DVIGDLLHDRFCIADREIIPGIAAGALPVRLEQCPECRIVGAAKAERDAGTVMIVVDRAPFLDTSGFDRGDDRRSLLRRLRARRLRAPPASGARCRPGAGWRRRTNRRSTSADRAAPALARSTRPTGDSARRRNRPCPPTTAGG